MSRGRKRVLLPDITPEEHTELCMLARRRKIARDLHNRVLAILKLESRETTITDVAHAHSMSRRNLYKWLRRFQSQRVAGLFDRERLGRPAQKDATHEPHL